MQKWPSWNSSTNYRSFLLSWQDFRPVLLTGRKLYIFRACWYLTSNCFCYLKKDSELGIHSSFRQTSPWLHLLIPLNLYGTTWKDRTSGELSENRSGLQVIIFRKKVITEKPVFSPSKRSKITINGPIARNCLIVTLCPVRFSQTKTS